MNEQPENLSEVRQWVEKAEHDLRNAEHTLTLQEDCPYDTICFHAQQCVEKYIKAALLSRGVDFPKTHDLVVLTGLLGDSGFSGIQAADLTILNRYSIEARYPGYWDAIGRKQAVEAVAKAKEIRNEIRKLIFGE